MENYVIFSIETHLFFARIMKEHALFLEAGFPCKDREWIQRAGFFRQQFEELLGQTVKISDGMLGDQFLNSGEMVTEFTIPAEQRTSKLTGISIDSRISALQQNLKPGCPVARNRSLVRAVNQLNERGLRLLNGLIAFKEGILREVGRCRLFTSNYPLLIQHILREARLYRSILIELRRNGNVTRKKLRATEEFWNQIMMEHALFIRGLLDPSEVQLIETADGFAKAYGKLLEKNYGYGKGRCEERSGCREGNDCGTKCSCEEKRGGKEKEDCGEKQNCRETDGLRKSSLEETLKYREFKTAGAKGILQCEISSVILPLLADHVLREANHYIRILEEKYEDGEE